LAIGYAAAVVLLLVVPLVWTTGVGDPFRTPQRELALATLAVLAAAGLAVPGLRRRLADGWSLAWAGVLAAGVVAALASAKPGLALAGLVPLLFAAFAWLTLRQLDDDHRRRLRSCVVLAAAIQTGLAALFAQPGWRPAGFQLLDGLTGRFAWIGTLGNPGIVGVYLVLPSLLAAGLAFEKGSRAARWWAAGAIAVTGIIATRTITAAAALVLGLAVLFWCRLPRRRRVPALTALVAAAVVVAVVSPMRGRIVETTQLVQRGGWRWLASGRGAIVEAGVLMIAAHPWTGVGPGRFEAYSFTVGREDDLADRARVLGLITGFGEAHNDVLQFAAEHGAIGVALALAGLVLAWRRRPPGSGVLPAPGSLLAAATLLALTQFPLHHAATATQWLVIAALAVPRLAAADPIPGRGVAWRRGALAAVLAAVVVLIAWQRFTAERGVAQARRLSESIRSAPRPAALQPVARAARDNLARQLRWLPGNWRALLALGSLSVDAGEPSVARRQFEAALAIAERPETRFDLGVAALLSGDRDAALKQLERAVRLNPVLFREVRDEAARRELRARLAASGYVARHPWAFPAE
jgi:O-antigen ligase